ncbi:TonB family protein [Erwinia sorbitola]|uniref:TonB family protein n=1 Tax=Erwinia sorbitola TaxID=2681984 RepID=A0A6I6ELN8_9GAMM|nr:energy transducer TonB [Erwinia sorbitola]MTD27508.1 TonB family protein [Erwinia sorbitola]QGU89045.1 TonB family protein [Erwinia sorbitola]
MSALFNAITPQPESSWGKGALLSLSAHLILALLAVVTFEKQSIETISPAAVMLEFAPEVQTAITRPALPTGVNQQRRVEASKAEVTPEKPETARAVEADEGELALQKPEPAPKPVKKRDVPRENSLNQQALAGNSLVTSQAAPQPQQKRAEKTAAPVESDAAHNQLARITWEGLVMGALNRVKQYPAEAKRRGRAGVARVTFTVNGRGEILASQLADSSGTIALDREALAMLQRASPLPPPPENLLEAGRYRITLPVSFDLKK